MHLFDSRHRLPAARGIGLVGYNDERETMALQLFETRCSIRRDNELFDGQRGAGLTVRDKRLIEDAVPVEKHGPRSRLDHVFACLSAGCETNKCQMVPWKASACGVM